MSDISAPITEMGNGVAVAFLTTPSPGTVKAYAKFGSTPEGSKQHNCWHRLSGEVNGTVLPQKYDSQFSNESFLELDPPPINVVGNTAVRFATKRENFAALQTHWEMSLLFTPT